MTTRHRWTTAAALVMGALVIGRLALGRSADSALARLHAQGLPTNPDELDHWYPFVEPVDNQATAILAAATACQNPRDPAHTPYTGILEIPPYPADPQLVARWQAELTHNAAVFSALAAGSGRSGSRYPIDLRTERGAPAHLARLKNLAQFLALASLTEAESGHPAEAARHVEELLGLARSLETEPLMISQLIRCIIVRIACGAVATSLPRTAVDEAGWKTLQEAFTAATTHNTVRSGLAGEIVQSTIAFAAPPGDLADLYAKGPAGLGVKAGALFYVASGLRAADQRFCLDRLAESLDASTHPFPEALRLSRSVGERVEQEGARPARGGKFVSWLLLQSLQHILQPQAESAASLRVAVVECAIERHRLTHSNQLPETLADLVPALIPAMPIDPFDGQPLRYRHTNDTYVVYSVGPDRRDDGGESRPTSNPATPTDDIGFRIVR